jgi:glucose-6-phosphate dehydrogenase assembly protein OpcA
MTLIAATEGEPQEIAETLALLMRDHPSRLIVLHLRPGDQPELNSRVVADCWMPFGGRQQICCERIEINATRTSFAEVPPVLRGLIVPDLPVTLWCRSRSMTEDPAFREVLPLAGKVIVDSAEASDPAAQLDRIRRLRASGHAAADLAWTRLTRWREAIAQVFDDPEALERAQQIDTLSIDFEGGCTPVSALYLAAWVENSLGRKLKRSLRCASREGRPRVRRLALTDDSVCYSVTVGNDRCASVQGLVRDAHTLFPRLSDYELMREELAIPGVDRSYDAVLDRAAEMAREAG